jgi:hypothetical protein
LYSINVIVCLLYIFDLNDGTGKGWPFNTGDCLIEVAAWVGLTVSTWTYPYCMLKDQENFVYTIIFNSQTSHNFMFLLNQAPVDCDIIFSCDIEVLLFWKRRFSFDDYMRV